MLSPAELLRRDDSSPLRDAVEASRLDSWPDSMDGIEVFGWLLLVFGMPWLERLDELLEGMLLLAVCGWLWLDELLELEELDWDCEGELEDDWDWEGCAGGCCWVCWLLQPVTTALTTIADASVRQPMLRRKSLGTAFRSVIVSLLTRSGALSHVSDFCDESRAQPGLSRWPDAYIFPTVITVCLNFDPLLRWQFYLRCKTGAPCFSQKQNVARYPRYPPVHHFQNAGGTWRV